MDSEMVPGVELADRTAVGVLTRTFPVELVDRVIYQYWRGEQRVRALPTRLVFYYVLALCLFPHESYRSALRILLGSYGRASEIRVPTNGAIVNARRRLGSEPVETIARAVMRPAADRDVDGAWYQDWRLVGMDGTVFTVPDSESNDQEFGRPGSGRGQGRTAYPQIRAACLVELGTHAVFDARMAGCAAYEAALGQEMFPSLRPGMLVLADRYFYSFDRWSDGLQTGADLLWRVTANLTLRPVELLSDGSYLAEVIPPRKNDMSFVLRVIEYRVPGGSSDGKNDLYRLVTSILDPAVAPANELAALYHERWEIEGFFKQIKSVQLNDSRIFRSKSPDGVRQEFWSHLAVHYATIQVIAEAARAAHLDPDRISHKNTVRIIRSRIWKPEVFPPG